jgi:hypothetical protein
LPSLTSLALTLSLSRALAVARLGAAWAAACAWCACTGGLMEKGIQGGRDTCRWPNGTRN